MRRVVDNGRFTPPSGSRIMLRPLLPVLLVLSASPSVGSDVTFESHVRPILKAHCFQCHGEAGEKQGGLDLRLRRFIAAGGESGPAFVENNPSESYILERVLSGEMPPGDDKQLSKADIRILDEWIKSGAKTAREEPTEIGDGPLFTEEERNYWAFQSVRRPAIPTLSDASQVRTPIDAFLLAVCRRSIARCLGTSGRSTAGLASVRRALGPALARRCRLRRLGRLYRRRSSPQSRVPVS